jgi:hypothetical protein
MVPAPDGREPRPKLPNYKGLENFKLIDKMGESVLQGIYTWNIFLNFEPPS